MGEAKRRENALREMMIKEFQGWQFKMQPDEIVAYNEIEKLKTVIVKRYPEDKLEYMRMKPKLCHDNCEFLVENDPNKETIQVVGWLNAGHALVLHSVIRRGEEYFCVTPPPIDGIPEIFSFRPDPEIRMKKNKSGTKFDFYRNEYCLPKGIRREPERVIGIFFNLEKKLVNGANPYEILNNMDDGLFS